MSALIWDCRWSRVPTNGDLAAGMFVKPKLGCSPDFRRGLLSFLAGRCLRQDRRALCGSVLGRRHADQEQQACARGLLHPFTKPKSGYDYLATAAHFAVECSTCTNVNVCTIGDFTKSIDAFVYGIDLGEEAMKIACPTPLFDLTSPMTGRWRARFDLGHGHQPGLGDVEYGKISDIYLPRRSCAWSMDRLAVSSTCGASWAGARPMVTSS